VESEKTVIMKTATIGVQHLWRAEGVPEASELEIGGKEDGERRGMRDDLEILCKSGAHLANRPFKVPFRVVYEVGGCLAWNTTCQVAPRCQSGCVDDR
jgi:hypothetical protein